MKIESFKERLRIRFELEFERIDDELKEVLDVEEIRAK